MVISYLQIKLKKRILFAVTGTFNALKISLTLLTPSALQTGEG